MRHAGRIISDLRKLDAALREQTAVETTFAMHYKNGREAKIGDRVVVIRENSTPLAGVLVEANPNSPSCNGRVIGEPALSNASYVTLSDCIHAEDVLAKPGA